MRRDLRHGDAEAIVALHERLYRAEHGMAQPFVDGVAAGVKRALARGWPQAGGGVWVVERERRFAGCAALTDEGEGLGCIRWVLLAPELHGAGLGRTLIGEAVTEARDAGLRTLRLDTFSALRAAAAIYRDLGFVLVRTERTERWGPPIDLQRYELKLPVSGNSD